MTDVFFDELGMPRPDVYLGVGSGIHAEQTAQVMIALRAGLSRRSGPTWSSSSAT